MNLLQVFTTPIWESQLPAFDELKEKFIESVNSYKESNPIIDKGDVVKGFQTAKNLQQVRELSPLYEYVSQMSLKAAFDLQFPATDVFITTSWATYLNGPTQYVQEHVHFDTFSGVFYLKVPENVGKLVLSNQSINNQWQGLQMIGKRNKFTSEKLHIEPVEGHIFLWPSYLPHRVEPTDSEGDRISISFNVIAMPKGFMDNVRNGEAI
jgi:uncharacterized protein (TIGR02466 family)